MNNKQTAESLKNRLFPNSSSITTETFGREARNLEKCELTGTCSNLSSTATTVGCILQTAGRLNWRAPSGGNSIRPLAQYCGLK